MRKLSFVCCINRPDIARSCALASPCLLPGAGHQLILVGGANSAGSGMSTGLTLAKHEWVVMFHQDVFLPDGWDRRFNNALDTALVLHPNAAVVGVYGVQADATHVGYVYDRDRWIGSALTQPMAVRSLDELLLAVRVGSGLCPAPELGWHLYGTDLCLAAHARGLEALVVDAPCEHRSSLPRLDQPLTAAAREHVRAVGRAYGRSAEVLLQRWPHAAPIHTPVMSLHADFLLEQTIAWVDTL